MAGFTAVELRVEIDESAMHRLRDFGQICVAAPEAGSVEAIRIVYVDEDLERNLSEES